jgi:hypothetical protein
LGGGDGAEEIGLGLEVVRDLVLRFADLALGIGEGGALGGDLAADVARQAVEAEEGHDDQSCAKDGRGEGQKWALHGVSAGKRSHLPRGRSGTWRR